MLLLYNDEDVCTKDVLVHEQVSLQ